MSTLNRSSMERPYATAMDTISSDNKLSVRSTCLGKLSNALIGLVTSYTFYYIVSLLTNAVLLALYTVQTFASHEPCLTKQGKNITGGFILAFQIGFGSIAVETFVANIINVSLRAKAQKEERYIGLVTTGTRRMTLIFTYLEWTMRITVVAVSIMQSLVINSKSGLYCMYRYGALQPEGNWIYHLILLQVSKEVFLSVWQTWQINLLNQGQRGSDTMGFSDCRSTFKSSKAPESPKSTLRQRSFERVNLLQQQQQQQEFDQDFEERESLLEDLESIEAGYIQRRFNLQKPPRQLKKAKSQKLRGAEFETSPRLQFGMQGDDESDYYQPEKPMVYKDTPIPKSGRFAPIIQGFSEAINRKNSHGKKKKKQKHMQ